MRLITGPPPGRSAPVSGSQGRAAESGCHLASGARRRQGPRSAPPDHPGPTTGLFEWHPPVCVRAVSKSCPDPPGPPATVSPAFLRRIWYFLLFSPSPGERPPGPACRGRSWRSPAPRVPELAGGFGKTASVFSPRFGT